MSAATPIPVVDKGDAEQLTTQKRDGCEAATVARAARELRPLTTSLAEPARWLPLPSPTFRNPGRLLPNGYRRP